ncbi:MULTISPECIES: TetR/AcrR family transcriptional regulator [Duganella]|uniref:TetR family transcriptional regulator n=2 Tax=Duganella TaxID=75654 RepID=A0A845GNK8_9BURK|nr:MULTISPECIES: TetR/AcrR family transcriptional regulator [Duganella]MYM80763.1 TetR family transcriptional regulator [Duganella lactea]MYM96133.1 TetR family transcriptional regulator [Duganella vulcania]
MTDKTTQHRHRLPPSSRGRTQDVSRDNSIINATLELLVESGYHRLNMAAVATRAGVSKATIYRRWTTKEDLVADSIATIGYAKRPVYPGTSLRNDLLALLEQACGSSSQQTIVTAAMEVARSSPELGKSLRSRFVEYVHKEITWVAERAVNYGYAPLTNTKISHISDTAVALLIYISGPTSLPVAAERLAGIVDHVLLVLMTTGRP